MAGIKTPIRIMNKSDRKFAIAAMLCGIATALVSCYYEAGEIETTEQEVVFSAATQYENLPETRTVYSGDLVDVSGANRERIDWVAGTDKIKILNANTQAVATYTVGTPSATNEKSVADVTADATKLTWSGDGNANTFYAVYPSTANSDAATHTFGASIPADQSAQNETHTGVNSGGTYTNPVMSQLAYMVAKVENAPSGQNVTLPFYPAMTAFEFNVAFANDGGDAPTITSFDMVSEASALTGNWSWNGSTFTCPARSAGNNDKITVNFTGGRQVTAANPLKFTVFALPQNITQVKLVFHLTSGDKTLSLKQSGAWTVFDACKKYRITTPGLPGDEVWTYVIEEIQDITTYGHLATTSSLPFNVTSYKYKNGDQTNKVPVSWTIEYSPNNSSWSTSHDGKIGVDLTSGGGGTTLTVNNGANVLRDHNSSEYTGDDPDVVDGATAKLRSAADIPMAAMDSDGYYDLSKHPVYGTNQFGSPQNMETANCYVVQGPGLYKFPLVYGNAIRNGATNSKSYAPTLSSPTGHFLSNFIRHDGQAIAGPWITTDNSISVSDAIIVWQDGTDNAGGQIIKDADVSVDGNYIKFEVKRGLIRPGNVIIAARNSAGTIVWSWHIWVTEKDLTPKTVKDGLNNTLSMMNYNLGWMDATSARSTKYNNWTMYIKVSQTETGGTFRTFRVRQIGDVISVDANVGCNTFYQWGRKDPMLPATGDNEDKAQYSAHNLRWESSKTHRLTSGGIEQSIVHPNWQLVNLNGTEAHYCGLHYGNLWDSELDNGGNVGQYGNRFAVKTVYDPCPPGYVVPYEYAFSGVSKNANVLNYAYYPSQLYATYNQYVGYTFNIPSSDVMYFPFCGARAHHGDSTDSVNGSIYDVRTLGYYWTSCPLNYASTVNASGVQERQAAKMMILLDGTLIRPGHEQRKGAAYAIRPILQVNY